MNSQFKRDFAAKWNAAGFNPRILMLCAVGVRRAEAEKLAAVKWRQLSVELHNGLLASAYGEE